MSGVLRTAHAIARGLEGERLDAAASVGEEEVNITVTGSGNPEAAVVEARQASGLLERALGRKVRIESAVTSEAARTA